MESPFYVEGPVPPAQAVRHFHARETDRAELARVLTRGRPPRRLVIGPAGRGKTSLANAVLHDLGPLRPHIGLDVARITPANPWGLLAQFSEAWGPEWAQRVETQRARRQWVDLFPEFRRRFPRGTTTLLVLDNAHALEEFPADFAQAWANELRDLTKAPILMLAERAVRLFSDFETQPLEPFPRSVAQAFLEPRLEQVGIRVPPEVLESAFSFAQGEPELLQRIGHGLSERLLGTQRRAATDEDLADVLSRILDRLPPSRAAQYAAVRGQTLDLLVAMAVHGDDDPTTLARRVDMDPKNAVVLLTRAGRLTGLIERRWRGSYTFRDPLFRAYLKKEYANARF